MENGNKIKSALRCMVKRAADECEDVGMLDLTYKLLAGSAQPKQTGGAAIPRGRSVKVAAK